MIVGPIMRAKRIVVLISPVAARRSFASVARLGSVDCSAGSKNAASADSDSATPTSTKSGTGWKNETTTGTSTIAARTRSTRTIVRKGSQRSAHLPPTKLMIISSAALPAARYPVSAPISPTASHVSPTRYISSPIDESACPIQSREMARCCRADRMPA